MKIFLFKIIEVTLFPITLFSAIWMKFLTFGGIDRSILAEKTFLCFGILPIRDHYYQPLINPKKHLTKSLREDRVLKGLDFNIKVQLNLLNQFSFNEELKILPVIKKRQKTELQFYYNNNSFESGDAEYYYNIIRFFKPNKLIEIGSGFSTLMAEEALIKNKEEDNKYAPEHICIEPYEQGWLEKTKAKILRKKVENIEISFFKSLGKNDILFIDSSHIIRPQGDVLFEILEILPVLSSGVIVHIHDIFSPKDYPDDWILKEHRLWNEQYLLEAFLSHNKDFEIIGSLNYLMHNYPKQLKSVSPILNKQKNREPGSFWIRKK